MTWRAESGDLPLLFMEADPPSYALPVEAVAIGQQNRADLLRVIWTLAWPVIISFLLQSVVGLVDVLMVGRLGAAAVAAVGIGAQILSAVSIVMTAVSTGTLALVARHIGARQPHAAEAVLCQSITAACALSVLGVVPVMALAAQLVQLFGVDPPVVVQGSLFVRLVMLSIPQSAVVFVITAALRGAGDTRTPLLIGVVINIVNVAAGYVLIFGKLGFPALGVGGSALGTTIAFTCGALLGLAMLSGKRLALRVSFGRMRPHLRTIRRVLAIGYPAAAEQALMQIGFFLYLVFAARYGTSAVAAYVIGVRILALSFLPGFGFGMAAGALVGQNLGARNPDLAERSGWESTRLAIYLMSVCGVVLFVFARPIATFFVDDPAVVTDAVSFIRTLAAAQPLMGIDSTIGGALRGAGDTRFPLWAVFIGFYGCRLGFAYLAADVLHLTLPWLWFALMGDYLARALLKAWRFHGGRWKHIVV